MATAEISSPAGNGQAEAVTVAPLWGDIDIPIIIGTGEFGQGKTLFGLTICPGPQTLCYDNEGSSLSYRSLDFQHVDMASELRKKYANGFTAEQRYLWWREDALKRGKQGGKAGKFRVLMTDPMSEIEDGVAEHVRKHCSNYGLTVAQCDKAPGLFWAAVKKQLQADLDLLRTYYETCYATVHMRDQYVGNSRTGKREPKGKETLFQLASLFLEFEREKDKKGSVAAAPSANVMKQRLVKTLFVDGELKIVPVLPPRLPIATPKAIREYIAAPPDYDKLKPNERVKEHEMSEEDKLRLQATIAEKNAEAANAELARIDRMNAAAAAQAAAKLAAPVAPDMSANHAETMREKAASAGAAAQQPVSAARVDELVRLLNAQFGDQDQWAPLVGQWLAEMGVERVSLLTDAQSEGFEAKIWAEVHDRKTATLAAKRAELEANPDPHDARQSAADKPIPVTAVDGEYQSPLSEEAKSAADEIFNLQDTVPFDVTSPAGELAVYDGGGITADQLEEAVRLIGVVFPTEPEQVDGLPPLLAELGAERVSKLSQAGAEQFICKLQELAARRPDAKGSVTPEQLQRIQKLAQETGWTDYDQQLKWLQDRGCQTFRDLSRSQADDRIEELLKIQLGFAGGMPGN